MREKRAPRFSSFAFNLYPLCVAFAFAAAVSTSVMVLGGTEPKYIHRDDTIIVVTLLRCRVAFRREFTVARNTLENEISCFAIHICVEGMLSIW